MTGTNLKLFSHFFLMRKSYNKKSVKFSDITIQSLSFTGRA
jgi:hypothetical protein